MTISARRIHLAHLPTPLWRNDALDALVGTRVWVKRDDVTGGAEAGNKLRKLEFLMADALATRATVVLTCGAAQSNHARATALVAAQLGLKSVLFLRTEDPTAPPSPTGNLMLDRLVDAEVRFVTPDQYQRRDELMAEVAAELNDAGEHAYVIPEGGSNGRGALGYVEAMREVRDQLDLSLGGGPAAFDAVVHACGSGGTAAGVALGAGLHNVAPIVCAMAVCDDRPTFEHIVERVVAEVRHLLGTEEAAAELRVIDEFKGPAYGEASAEQIDFIRSVARGCGLILDPVYSGKALFALARLKDKPERALFIHTGGLPGLLAQAPVFG